MTIVQRNPMQKTFFPYDFSNTAEIVPTLYKYTIAEDVYKQLMWLSNDNDARLHVCLVAAVKALLFCYTGNKDSIIGIPVYRQQEEAGCMNTVLVIRNDLSGELPFRALVEQVSNAVPDANDHWHGHSEILSEQLGKPVADPTGFPLFDVTVLLENIHNKRHVQHIPHNISFIFNRQAEGLECAIVFNAKRYYLNTIARLARHVMHLLAEVVNNMDISLGDLRLAVVEEEQEEGVAVSQNATEAALVEIWAEVLGMQKEEVSLDKDFFQMGGSSITAIRLAAKIHKKLNIKLSLEKIFRTGTIRKMAADQKFTE